MAIEQKSIIEIIKDAVNKRVDIPEFQREFVWDPEQVKLLVESLYRNYPIGSFLLWDSKEYQESKTAEGTQTSLWIVDGQQRTTALCLLVGQKPYWWDKAHDWNKALEKYDVMVRIYHGDRDDRVEFALPNPIRRNDASWISVRSVLSCETEEQLNDLKRQIVAKFSSDPMTMMKLGDEIQPKLLRLWNIRYREIPVIKISHEIEDVAEIFARLNQEGTRVREADVYLALAAALNPGWIREQYLPFRNDLEERGWKLDAGVLIRTLTGIGVGKARLIEVPKNFWMKDGLLPTWVKARDTISEVIKRLGEQGILSNELLPSSNSLVPLFVLHYQWQGRSNYRFARSLHWFLLANWDGRYSGSAITSMNEDIRTITEASDFGEALECLYKRLRISEKAESEEFLKRYDRWGGAKGFQRLVLFMLIYCNGAKDWVDKTRIGYDKTGSPISVGFEPQWHHIFPKSILRKAHVDSEQMNAIANITVMNERTNCTKLAAKKPWEYIQQFGITPDLLQPHFIPEPFIQAVKTGNSKQWDTEHYFEFIQQRASVIAQATNDLFAKLKA